MKLIKAIKNAIKLITEYEKARKEFSEMLDRQIKFTNEVIEWSKKYAAN